MSMNFGSFANTKPASTVSYLKPYEIHENVTIKSSKVNEGTTKDGKPWKSLNITFGNDKGIYNHSIFYITSEKDFERGSYDMANGGKRQTPSKWESTRDTMASIGFAYFKEQFEKLQKAAAKAKSFDEIAILFKKMVDASVDKNPTNMKLVGRNSDGRVYAALPKCTGIAQANSQEAADRNNCEVGEWYTWLVSPFGEDLSFSNYELGEAEKYKNAKPTQMNDTKKDDPFVEETKEDEEDDLDTMLAGL